MSDLVITAANVAAPNGSRVEHGKAGAAVTAGQTVYLDEDTNSYKLADADSGTEAARSTTGIALHAAANGQPLAVHTRGPITIGAAVTQGVAYYQSATPGGICPVADLGSGDYPTFIGFAINATQINVDIKESGVALA